MTRFLLSTYFIHFIENESSGKGLKLFEEYNEPLLLFMYFLKSLHTNSRGRVEGMHGKYHLSLDSDTVIEIDDDQRSLYGYLSGGISGDSYKIRDLETNNELMTVEKRHAAFRNIFFYIRIPSGSTTGVLILQRRGKFGIKEVLYRHLNGFLREYTQGYYRVEINNILHGQVFSRMLEAGSLKKIAFIKRSIPKTLEEFFQNNGKPDTTDGILKTSFESSKGLSDAFKATIAKWWKQAPISLHKEQNKSYELLGVNDTFDEVEFELDVQGKKKTFYMYYRDRIQPDVDVTSELKIIDGEPTLESLVKQARELITLIELPLYANEN